jgi:hypothetical protein
MADMSEFLGFLGNVLAHWIALMSGLFSLVLALIGQAKKWRREVPRLFWVFAAFAVYVSCFQAWKDEHRNSEVLKQEKAALTGENNTCTFERALLERDVQSLNSIHATDADSVANGRKTIDHQVAQIGQCLIDEGKMNPVINTKFKVLVIPFKDADVSYNAPPVPNQSVKWYMMLIQVNRRQEPYGTLSCAQQFDIVTPPRITRITPGLPPDEFTHPQQVDPGTYILHFLSGEVWEDSNPIHFIVKSQSDAVGLPGLCTFKPSL